MSEQSLGRRYLYKLAASLLGLPMSLAVHLMATRALGPATYGSVSFLNGFFSEVIGFCDSGTSAGFYTKLCARPGENGLIAFYWRFVAAVFLLLVAVVALILLMGGGETVWPSQAAGHVLLAALSGLGVWALNIGGKIMDAFGLTVAGEKARLLQRVASVMAIAALWAMSWLNLATFFVAQIALSGLQLWLWQGALRRSARSLVERRALSTTERRSYQREFWDYSHPLLASALVGMVVGVADRWLLQTFAGSVQQGYYGLALQLGTICFLLTNAIIPLVAREFSQAFQARDFARMRGDFRRHLTRFYTLSAFVGIFVAAQADHVAVMFGGAQFAGAAWPLLLMCVYPIHQTYGQLNISVFYATGQTRLYRNLTILNMVAGFGLTFWFVAPASNGGLDLGSTGLALKMVALQLVAVNVQLWFNARTLGLSFLQFIGHQIAAAATLGLLALASRLAVDAVDLSAWLAIVLAGIGYATGALGCVLVWPGLAGFTRAEIANYLATLRRGIRTGAA